MIIFDYTFFIVLLGTTLVGISCGIIGCYMVLQRKSLFGDAIAHATLPGLTTAFLYTNCKNPFPLFIGATISSLLGAWLIMLINQHTTLKKETALGIVLATSFGIGTLLLSIIQTNPNAQKSGINKFLLGNPATLLSQEFIIIACIALLVIITCIYCWKEFKLFIFNQEFAHSIGFNIELINIIMTLLSVFAIIIGLQTVGVVLMSALLIAPACAAYQWTHHLSYMMILSCLFSCIATISGTIISCMHSHVPTGPVIIIIATTITFISLIFAPSQGIIPTYIKRKKQRKKIDAFCMLKHFLLFNEGKTDPFYAHDIKALQAIGKQTTNRNLQCLQQLGLIENTKNNFWRLTPKGLQVLQHHESIL